MRKVGQGRVENTHYKAWLRGQIARHTEGELEIRGKWYKRAKGPFRNLVSVPAAQQLIDGGVRIGSGDDPI
jgi:hypothetical protein